MNIGLDFETVYITKEYPHWTGEDAIANEVLKTRGIEEEPTIRVIQTQRELEKLPEQQRKEQEEKLLQYAEVCKQVYFQRRNFFVTKPAYWGGENKYCTRAFIEGPFPTKPAELKQELYECHALEKFIPVTQFPAHFERVELVNYGICDAVATHAKKPVSASCIRSLEKQVQTTLALFKKTYETKPKFCLQLERSYVQAITPDYLIRLFTSDWERHKTYTPEERRQDHLPQYPTIILSTFGKPGSFDKICTELKLHKLEDIFKNKNEKDLRMWHEIRYGLAHHLSLPEYEHNFGKHFSSGRVII